jgi:hypothetical protein
LALGAARFEGKHEGASGIVVVHEDLHLIEVLVGTHPPNVALLLSKPFRVGSV